MTRRKFDRLKIIFKESVLLLIPTTEFKVENKSTRIYKKKTIK